MMRAASISGLRWVALLAWGGAVLSACDDATAPMPQAVELELSSDSLTVIQDSTVQFWVTVREQDGELRSADDVEWSSSDTAIVKLAADGVALGIRPGVAWVRARFADAGDSAVVAVLPAVATIVVGITDRDRTAFPTDWSLVVEGRTEVAAALLDADGDTIEPRPLEWTSSDTTIAIAEGPDIVPLEPGSVTISAAREGVSGSLTFTVEAVSYASVSVGLFWPGAYGHACALSLDGAAYCWGSNELGELGNGTRVYSGAPLPVTGGLRFEAVSVGGEYSCGLTEAGAAHCWGSNLTGQLGAGLSAEVSDTPVAVAGGHAFATIDAGLYHACGLTASGAAYCWGWNLHGQLGDGTRVDRRGPVRAAGPLEFTQLSAGDNHTCGVATDGRTYCWGLNDQGQLGTGAAGGSSADPLPLAGDTTFVSISAGGGVSCGVATDGAAYCWGNNDAGQLGRGFNSDYELDIAPAQPGTAFSIVDAGFDRVCGIGTDATLTCWPGYVYPLFASVSAGLGRGYRNASCGIALDGYLYCWNGEIWRVVGQP